MAPLKPLVDTAWLADRISADNVRIADCRFYLAEPERGRREYLQGHIPAAVYFSLDDDLTGERGPGRHPLPDPRDFAGTLHRAGIGSDHTVIVYDDRIGAIAARMWWMLRSLGHQAVFVLDGGWAAWIAEGRPVATEIPAFDPATFSGAAEWRGTADRHQVAEAGSELLLIDARAAERYRGEEELIDPVAGHIPGAYNVPHQGNVDATGRFLSPAELAARFDFVDRQMVNYCGSGVTACHNLLAMELAGYEGALLYPGSWSDWCTNGGAVAKNK